MVPGMLSYRQRFYPLAHNFGTVLEPRWIVGTEPLDQ
jgi:hypothetical protein